MTRTTVPSTSAVTPPQTRPPVADFVGNPTSGSPPLTVRFIDESIGSSTGWSWDFGDGSSSSQQDTSHTYINPGTYTVRLQVANSAGTDLKTKVDYITVGSTITPPTANFVANPATGDAPLTVRFSDRTVGSPANWFWDFGDGGTSDLQNPLYTFTTSGTYTVRLRAGNSGGSSTATRVITVTSPATSPVLADFVASPVQGSSPLTVTFTDLSTGDPTSWTWDFGDGGSSTQQDPTHTYTSPGTYMVRLTARNSAGSDTTTGEGPIVVGALISEPVVDFIYLPVQGNIPLLVTFTDLSTGDPTSWAWDFGDGGSSNLQDPTHTYTSPGTYTVRLTVRNSAGTSTATGSPAIMASAPTIPPVANFDYDPAAGTPPLSVLFTDTSTGFPTSWSWNFGDGSTSTLQDPSHTYTQFGTFIVTLTARNSAGSSAAQGTVEVFGKL